MSSESKNAEEVNIPKHIAIIMDGNRRWSSEKNLPYIEGHKNALKRMEEIIEYASKAGIKFLTFWAWSTKNWKRSQDFIDDIIQLFRTQLDDNGLFARAIKKGARLHHIGKWDGFPGDISNRVMEKLRTKPDNPVIDVNLAVGYEGRDEIVRAVKKIVKEGFSENDITLDLVSNHLDTAGQPDVDLMIRTGGEKRTSGYLIWQIADAEYYFTDTYMPDFGVEAFRKALDDYSKRERRMGGDSKKY